MLGMLCQKGFEIVSDPAEADVLFVNTCGFIESAKEESIEAIFAPENLDEDCSRISELMASVANAIDQDLLDGRPADAVDLFLQLLDSLCYHFVADEHWRWFDDCYDPGYVADGCWKRIVECVGGFPKEVIERLRVGLGELCATEACREYGYPGIGRWIEEAGSKDGK